MSLTYHPNTNFAHDPFPLGFVEARRCLTMLNGFIDIDFGIEKLSPRTANKFQRKTCLIIECFLQLLESDHAHIFTSERIRFTQKNSGA
jgi:hypothetical protein